MISIAPRESLGPDTEMIIGDEWRRLMLRSIAHAKGVDVSEDDDGDGSEHEGLFPELPAIRVVQRTCCGPGQGLRTWPAGGT